MYTLDCCRVIYIRLKMIFIKIHCVVSFFAKENIIREIINLFAINIDEPCVYYNIQFLTNIFFYKSITWSARCFVDITINPSHNSSKIDFLSENILQISLKEAESRESLHLYLNRYREIPVLIKPNYRITF